MKKTHIFILYMTAGLRSHKSEWICRHNKIHTSVKNKMIKQLLSAAVGLQERVLRVRRGWKTLPLVAFKSCGPACFECCTTRYFLASVCCVSVCCRSEASGLHSGPLRQSGLQSQVFVFISTRINRLPRLFGDQDQVQLLARSRILDMFKYFLKVAQLAFFFLSLSLTYAGT